MDLRIVPANQRQVALLCATPQLRSDKYHPLGLRAAQSPGHCTLAQYQ